MICFVLIFVFCVGFVLVDVLLFLLDQIMLFFDLGLGVLQNQFLWQVNFLYVVVNLVVSLVNFGLVYVNLLCNLVNEKWVIFIVDGQVVGYYVFMVIGMLNLFDLQGKCVFYCLKFSKSLFFGDGCWCGMVVDVDQGMMVFGIIWICVMLF